MPYLREFSWWPSVWVTPAGWFVTHEEMIRVGSFQNARHSIDGLSLEAEHEGVICKATITSAELSKEDLILLRHILMQHHGEEMSVIANLNIDLSNTGV